MALANTWPAPSTAPEIPLVIAMVRQIENQGSAIFSVYQEPVSFCGDVGAVLKHAIWMRESGCSQSARTKANTESLLDMSSLLIVFLSDRNSEPHNFLRTTHEKCTGLIVRMLLPFRTGPPRDRPDSAPRAGSRTPEP